MLLVHYIQQQKNTQKASITSTVFLDIQGAFDFILKQKLLEILELLELPKPFYS